MNEKQIDLYMRKLDISREEAIALIADEEADNLPELSSEQRKVEKEMRKRYPHMKATGDDTYILDAKVRVLGKEQKLLGKVREYTMVE